MKPSLFKNKTVFFLGVLSLALMSCGKSDPGQSVGATTSCPINQYLTSVGCVPGGIGGGGGSIGNILNQCTAYGGTLVSNGTLCQYSWTANLNTGWIPRVDAQDHNESPKARTGQVLHPNDKIKLNELFPGASRYGTGAVCDIPLAGNSTSIRGGFRKGALLARINGDYFDLSDNQAHIVSNSGDLKIGYNLDISLFLGTATDRSGCTDLIQAWVTAYSCQDNYGNIVACP